MRNQEEARKERAMKQEAEGKRRKGKEIHRVQQVEKERRCIGSTHSPVHPAPHSIALATECGLHSYAHLENKRCTQQETRLRKAPNAHTAWQNMVRVAVYARNNIVLIFTPTSAVYTHNKCTDRHRRPGPNTQGLEQT